MRSTGLPSRASTVTASRKPFATSTLATASFSFDEGHSSSAWRACPALRMRASRSEMGSFMPRPLAPERHAQMGEQRARVVVPPGRGADGHVHAGDLLDLVVLDLREDDLLADAERVVAAAVEGLRRGAAEVAHARQRDVHEPVEELPHAVAAERHRGADRLALAHLEVRDRLLRAPDDRLLARDRRQLLRRLLEQLLVLGRLAEPDVDDDLAERRHLVRVRAAELARQLAVDLLAIAVEQPGRHLEHLRRERDDLHELRSAQ